MFLPSAVKVLNSLTGIAAVVYIQHDGRRQVTLISSALEEKLIVESISDPLVAFADEKVASRTGTNFTIKSLSIGEKYHISMPI